MNQLRSLEPTVDSTNINPHCHSTTSLYLGQRSMYIYIFLFFAIQVFVFCHINQLIVFHPEQTSSTIQKVCAYHLFRCWALLGCTNSFSYMFHFIHFLLQMRFTLTYDFSLDHCGSAFLFSVLPTFTSLFSFHGSAGLRSLLMLGGAIF